MPNISGQSPDTFPVYIKNITLYNRADKLKIDLEFVLKQFFSSNTSVSSAAAARSALNNSLGVLVVVSGDENVAKNVFTDRSFLKKFLNSNNNNTLVDRGTYGIGEAMLGDVATDALLDNTSVSYGDIYGTDLMYRKTFELPASSPDHLSIFAVPFIDSNEDGDLTIITADNVTLGKIASEMVIKKSSLNLQTSLFYTGSADNRIWTGEVHQDLAARWRTGTGASGRNSGQLLRVKKIINSKITDQRNLGRITRANFDFNKLNTFTALNKGASSKLRALEKIRNQNPTYLSPLYYAKDQNNDLSLYFGFDYLRALENEAKYVPLYKNKADKLTSCTVVSTSVIRRRINGPNIFNRLTGGDSPLRIFDEKIEAVGKPQRMSLGSEVNAFQYVIKDNQIKGITTGLYEYGFEITVEDNSKDKLMSILTGENGLDFVITELESFLTRSLLKGNYNSLTNLYTPSFSQKILATYGTNGATSPWVRGINRYINAIEFLTGIMDGENQAQLLIATNPLTTGPTGVTFLIKLLKDFSSSLRNSLGAAKGSKTTLSQAPGAPTSGGKRLFTIRQFFLEPVDADNLKNYGLDFLNLLPPAKGPKPAMKQISFDAWQDIVDNQAVKDNGITTSVQFLTPNFLKLPGRSPLNLYADDQHTKNIIAEGFYELLRANMYKNSPIFISTAININTNNTVLQQSNQAVVQNQNSLMHFNSCVATVFQSVPVNPVANVFAIPETNQQVSDDFRKGLDASSVISTTSEFITGPELEAINASLSGSNAINLLQLGGGGSTSNLTTQLVANVSSVSNFLLQGDFFNGKPNPKIPASRTFSGKTFFKGNMSTAGIQAQISQRNATAPRARGLSSGRTFRNPAAAPAPPPSPTEMALVAEAASDQTIHPEDAPLLAAKYGFVYMVEYMDSYYYTGQKMIISEPVWAPLTEGVVASVRARSAALVCRLKKHETYLADFDGLKMPIYNEIFIIGDAGISLGLPEPVSVGTIAFTGINTSLVENINTSFDSIEFANSYDSEIIVAEPIDPIMEKLIAANGDSPGGSTPGTGMGGGSGTIY